MAGVVDAIGHALVAFAGGSDPEGAPLLAPTRAEILDDLGRGVEQAAGEGIQKSSQHLGPRNDPAGGEPKGGGEGFEFAGKIGGLLGEIQAETEDG